MSKRLLGLGAVLALTTALATGTDALATDDHGSRHGEDHHGHHHRHHGHHHGHHHRHHGHHHGQHHGHGADDRTTTTTR